MIDYKLAKELKDAGFPQDGEALEIDIRGDDVYYPLLSELIEACGSGFKALQILVNDEMQVEWEATALGKDRHPKFGIGKTPEEAVARLWLALNKK